MNEISSLSNAKIKETVKLHQKKYRELMGLFIAEGEKTLQELLDNAIEIEDIFVLNGYNFDISKDLADKVSVCSEPVMKKLMTTDSIPKVVVVAKKKQNTLDKIKSLQKIALLENIKDPGNLGTIIRSAAAFGIDAILLVGDTIDLYNPKVIRSSAGNFFKLPVFELKSAKDIREICSGFTFVSTALQNKTTISIADAKMIDKLVVMFGSEASGLTDELAAIADKNFLINISKDVESLNLSVAASIVFHELYN